MEERLIKSKLRVQKHGEVFTPQWMVEKMLKSKEIRDFCTNLDTTFLEPAVGEGIFLTTILRKKLEMVEKEYANSLIQYENFSLYALSTLYGIEILEDNAQMCVMNLYETYLESYTRVVEKFSKNTKKSVLNSAKVIIKANIAQGDFLTQKTLNNEPIIITEWRITNEISNKTKQIFVDRTEYTLSEINKEKMKDSGNIERKIIIEEQLDMFDDFNLIGEENYPVEIKPNMHNMKYITVKITDLYKEEVEYI